MPARSLNLDTHGLTFAFSVVFKARCGVENESKTDLARLLFTGLLIFGLFAEMINYALEPIVSNVHTVAARLFIYKINGVPIGFSEVMGLLDSQIDTTYRLNWYNNVAPDTQLWFGNVSSSTAIVNV